MNMVTQVQFTCMTKVFVKSFCCVHAYTCKLCASFLSSPVILSKDIAIWLSANRTLSYIEELIKQQQGKRCGMQKYIHLLFS